MTSLSVDEIVGKLTKAEVIGCLPVGWLTTKDSRNWRNLKVAVDELSNDMKEVVYEAASTKNRLIREEMIARRKRKRMDYEWSRRLRRRVNDGEFTVIEVEGVL
jgi:KaiC/GvpD/RAD55 family RecA-like ATPase